MKTTTDASPEELRSRLVDGITTEDIYGLRDARVEAAVGTVPGRAFLPDVPLEEAHPAGRVNPRLWWTSQGDRSAPAWPSGRTDPAEGMAPVHRTTRPAP